MIQFEEHIFQTGWFNHQLEFGTGLIESSKLCVFFGSTLEGGNSYRTHQLNCPNIPLLRNSRDLYKVLIYFNQPLNHPEVAGLIKGNQWFSLQALICWLLDHLRWVWLFFHPTTSQVLCVECRAEEVGWGWGFPPWYCWWFRNPPKELGCTVSNLANNGITYQPQLVIAGFLKHQHPEVKPTKKKSLEL